jgi:hypothetical protein
MERLPNRLAVIAGAAVVVILVAGFSLYSSLPAASSSSKSPSDSMVVGLGDDYLTTSSSQYASRSSTESNSSAFPFANPGYLDSPSGCATSTRSSNGTAYAYAEPCTFSGSMGDALVFNCLAEAASSSGCSAQLWGVPNSTPEPPPLNRSRVQVQGQVPVMNNTITVWYPYVNQTGSEPSWANCMFQVAHFYPGLQYGFCIPVSSTAFVVSGPEVILPPE